MAKETVLVVEDDKPTLEFLKDNLTADRFQVLHSGTVASSLSLLRCQRCDLVLLDLNLPDASGFELCDRIRAADGSAERIDSRTPIIILSGRSAETDRLRGFQRGADDYLTKPFYYPELLARMTALLERSRDRKRSGKISIDDLTIDPSRRDVTVARKRVLLSAKEFALLQALATDPGRVWSKQELLQSVWGYQSLGRTRTLDSHASRLRRKLEQAGGRFVINVWGIGYRLVEEAA